MGSAIKILFFLIFFGVWIVKIAKKFSEMKNKQSQASYSPQRKEEIPQPADSFPELEFEKEQETHQASKEPVYEAEQDAVRGFLKELNLVKEEESQESINRLFEQAPEEEYIQPELVEDEVKEIPEEEFKKPQVALVNGSWKSEEVISTLSIGVSDARMGIVMSEILGKPIALR
ncbi:MAG: hypothetical protein ABIK53_05900 [bacterium]